MFRQISLNMAAIGFNGLYGALTYKLVKISIGSIGFAPKRGFTLRDCSHTEYYLALFLQVKNHKAGGTHDCYHLYGN